MNTQKASNLANRDDWMIRSEHVEHAETVFQGANKSAASPRKLRRIVRVRPHSRGLRGVSDRARVAYVNVFIGTNRLAPNVRNLYASAINANGKLVRGNLDYKGNAQMA